MIVSVLSVLTGLLLLPFSYKTVGHIVKKWGDFTRLGLKFICHVGFEIRGLEHLPKDRAVIIACKHQSAFETVGLFFSILPYPVYVLKADLDKIPFWRILSQKAGALSVQRSQGSSALKNMLKEARQFAKQGRSFVIFPEGTRTKIGEEGRYHSGVYGLAKISGDIEVIPAAINSGVYWSKGKTIKPNGSIILEFMPALAKNLDKKEFLHELKEKIEQKTRLLEQEALSEVKTSL